MLPLTTRLGANKQTKKSAKKMRAVLLCFCVLISAFSCNSYDVIEDYISPASCSATNDTNYFDSLFHRCKSCGANQTSSEDRLSCKCLPGYKISFSEKTKSLECVTCEHAIQREICLKENHTCGLYDIKGCFFYNFILIQYHNNTDRFIKKNTVLQITGNETVVRCLTCPFWHQSDQAKSTCIPCFNACHCPFDYEDVQGSCVKKSDIISDSPTLYTLSFQGRYYSSSYMKQWVQPVASKCKVYVAVFKFFLVYKLYNN